MLINVYIIVESMFYNNRPQKVIKLNFIILNLETELQSMHEYN